MLIISFSDWINAEDSQCVSVTRGDAVVSWDTISKGAGACIRLEIHTAADVKSGLCYLTLVPLSHTNLVKLCERWEVDLGSPRVPVIACSVGDPSKNKKSLETSLMVQEDKKSGCGLGILPLIQQVENLTKFLQYVVFQFICWINLCSH